MPRAHDLPPRILQHDRTAGAGCLADEPATAVDRLTSRLGYPSITCDERIPFVWGQHCDLKHPETFLK
jgi:hypothetical protein